MNELLQNVLIGVALGVVVGLATVVTGHSSSWAWRYP